MITCLLLQLDTEEVQDLFNLGSSQKEPILSKLDHETVLVGYEYKSVVFDNSVGVPRKDYYFMWSNIPSFIGMIFSCVILGDVFVVAFANLASFFTLKVRTKICI